ncbi:unnamed protein product [Clonostachys chloroleuca]|uniref:Rhodopsin domain-containing protein n=1 Tax=Clonostachys chloroleuca TaxID=1926264 RepID=A0AA35Q3M7_9HYPO|nr:unnamed protein product [Clonostachys chloroleuca]
MHLSWQQKVAIIGLFASGIIVVSCSVLVLIQVIMYKPVDASYTLSLVKLLLWGNAEVNLAIFCFPFLFSSEYSSSQQAAYPCYDQYFAELFPEGDGGQAPNWSHLNMVLDLLK